jgi:hypothetical protein
MIESGVFECMFFSAGFPTLIAIDADIEKKHNFSLKNELARKQRPNKA